MPPTMTAAALSTKTTMATFAPLMISTSTCNDDYCITIRTMIREIGNTEHDVEKDGKGDDVADERE